MRQARKDATCTVVVWHYRHRTNITLALVNILPLGRKYACHARLDMYLEYEAERPLLVEQHINNIECTIIPTFIIPLVESFNGSRQKTVTA